MTPVNNLTVNSILYSLPCNLFLKVFLESLDASAHAVQLIFVGI